MYRCVTDKGNFFVEALTLVRTLDGIVRVFLLVFCTNNLDNNEYEFDRVMTESIAI